MAMTTQQHSEGVTVTDDAWIYGDSKKRSYISPWYVSTLKHRDFDHHQGKLKQQLVEQAVETLHQYTPLSD